MKTVGLATALLVSASAAAMSAVLFVPTNGGVPVANELFGTSIVVPGAAANSVRIESSGVGTFTNSIMRVTFSLSGGASFNSAVPAGALTGDLNTGFGGPVACTVVPTVTVQAGGAVGDTSVTFEVANASSCRALRLNLAAVGLKGITQGSKVDLSATLTTQAGTPIDSGVINSPLTYITQVDGNTGSIAAPVAHTIDLATTSKQLVPSAAATATTFVTGLMKDTLATAFGVDLLTQWRSDNNNATGVLTLSGIPAAVVVAPDLRFGAATADLAGHGGAAPVGTCVAPAAGTSTCTLNNAAMQTIINAPGTVNLTALFTVNGTTTIVPSTINGKLVVSYAATAPNYNPIASETKFDGTVASLGLNACIAEFASIMNNPSSVSTIRLSNTTATPAKVYIASTTDAGANSAVVPVTIANVPTATLALDASNLLKPGATIEMTGNQIATATGQDFTSWSGVSRGRVRVYLETAASGAVGSVDASNNKAGCTAEGFTCVNGTCSIMQPTTLGKDGQPIAAQNK